MPVRSEPGRRSTFWPLRVGVSRAAVAKLAVAVTWAVVAAEQRRFPARAASRTSGVVAQRPAPRPVPTQEQPRLASVRCKWRSRGIAPRCHCGRMCTCHRSSSLFAPQVSVFCCCKKRVQEHRYASGFRSRWSRLDSCDSSHPAISAVAFVKPRKRRALRLPSVLQDASSAPRFFCLLSLDARPLCHPADAFAP